MTTFGRFAVMAVGSLLSIGLADHEPEYFQGRRRARCGHRERPRKPIDKKKAARKRQRRARAMTRRNRK